MTFSSLDSQEEASHCLNKKVKKTVDLWKKSWGLGGGHRKHGIGEEVEQERSELGESL